jgi:exonuclease III
MDDVYNLSRTAEAIRQMNVDIIGLQEVDNNTDRHPHDNQAQVLANLTGLTYHLFAKFRDFESGGYGVAILSRFPIESSSTFHFSKPSLLGECFQLSSPFTWTLNLCLFVGAGEPKTCAVPFEGDYCQGAVVVKVNTGSQKIWFGTTHLGWPPQLRNA